MIALVIFVLVIVLFNLITTYFFGLPLSPVAITGKVIETGYVRLTVEGAPKIITIHSPENTTYNFDKGDTYFIDLNVSRDFFIENNSNWTYWLYDLKHGEYIYEGNIFTPNITVPFVRWGNVLTVSVEEEDADWVNNSIVFTVYIPNSAPLIQNFSEKIFVCESEEIHNLDDSQFNVWDIDEEDFSSPDDYDINGWDVFGLSSSFKISNYITPFRIISGPMSKANLRSYIVPILVFDSYGLPASNVTNITVIEINNAPEIFVDERVKVDGIGAQTIYMTGANSVFVHQMNVSDTEDGWSSDGNLTFNFTGDLNFNFNSSTGNMSYVPQEGDYGLGDDSKTYELTVCALDNALSSVHENFSICSDRGYSSDNLSVCDDFTLTITNENRVPSIDIYSPTTLTFSIPGTTTNLFGVTVSDADMSEGFYPDIDWYIDGVLVESNENEPSDDFSYAFGCGVSGNHNVTAVTSDGPANDSVIWNISVTNVDCPVETGGGSGGGGGGGSTLGGACLEQWLCHGWGLCQNAERSFDAGSLSLEDYSSTKDLCAQNQYDNRFCGFQITKCFDLNQCNNTEMKIPKPSELRICYFTENPNCRDGITNCHDNDCELLVDCGGPCGPCPTCSDGKKNQGENGVDCGGPCPYACESESPYGAVSFVLIGLVIVFLIVVIFILIKLINILRYRFFLVGKKKRSELRASPLMLFSRGSKKRKSKQKV